MKMPVLKRIDKETTELVELDIRDVAYVCIENRTIVYHTETEHYYHISTLGDLEDHLYEYGFDLTDKTNLVNFNKIKKLDSRHGKIYFEEEPTKKSKYATIAFIKQKLFKNEILQAIAENTNKLLEYSVKDGKNQKTSSSAQEEV